MNRVVVEHKRGATFTPYKRGVDVELIRITSDFYFLSSSNAIDTPKERGT